MSFFIDYVNQFDRNQLILSVSASVAVAAIFGANKLLGNNRDYQRLLEARKQLQTVEIGPALPGEGAIRRSTQFKDKLIELYDPKITTLAEVFATIAAANPQSPCLGVRQRNADGTVGDYTWITYAELAKRRDNFGSGLINLGHKVDEPIGIYSINRPEWIVADLAAGVYRSPSVALYDTLGQNAIEFIIKHAEIKSVVCAAKQLPIVFGALVNCPLLKTIVSMDKVTEEHLQKAKSLGVRLVTMGEVEELGAKNPREQILPRANNIYTIMYTSGTTGDPKGVILTHGNLIAELAAVRSHANPLFTQEDVHMSYLPLAHSFERATLYTMLSYGAKIGFYQGNVNELFNDIAALRPTFLVGAPRVWSRLYDKLLMTVNSGSSIKKKLFHWGFAAKQEALRNGQATPLWDKILFSKMKARLGGRVRFILSGSAPLDAKLAEFLKVCFCCTVLEGYGLTENAAGALITDFNETLFGHVGRPIACNEVKLVDVPEMNYSSRNNPPTGEIMLRGYNVFKGYYKDPEKTKEALEADGFFHTGDIGRWNENGTLTIIDRKKNIFKLAQGEYVAVEYLEGVYIRSPFVSQVWVYGSSYKRYVVAVVVPDADYLSLWASQNSVTGDYKSLCVNPVVIEAIQKDLTKIGSEAKLHGFEYVKAIHVVSDLFTVDNDLMTPTFKLRRPNLVKHFQKEIDQMYEKIGDA